MNKKLSVSQILNLLHKKFGKEIFYARNLPYSNQNYCVCVIKYKSAEITVNFNTKNQTLSVAVDKNIKDKNEILQDFTDIFDNVMQKPYLCKFDDKIEGKKQAISVIQWCDNVNIAEFLLNGFIRRSRHSEGGIDNLIYNKNYGETKFKAMFDKNKIPELAS